MRVTRKRRKNKSLSLGSRSGLAAGYHDGYHLGRCQSAQDHIHAPLPVVKAIRVMYVAQGTPGFHTIDIGITQALRAQVREVIVVRGTDPVANIALQVRPDLVLVLNGIFTVGTDQIDRIRAAGIRTAVWLADDPYFTDMTIEIASHYDVIFTHELSCVALYRDAGNAKVHYLPFGANTEMFRAHYVEHQKRVDILFIGTAFPNRITFFNQMTDYLIGKSLLIAGGGWDRLDAYERLRSRIQLAGIDPNMTADYYSGAKIVINLHRGEKEEFNTRSLPALSINPRAFEINACGTLQLVDERAELAKHYVPGQEIETFHSPLELMEKIDYYLRYEAHRRDIAYQGLRRTLSRHTYHHRLAALLSVVME